MIECGDYLACKLNDKAYIVTKDSKVLIALEEIYRLRKQARVFDYITNRHVVLNPPENFAHEFYANERCLEMRVREYDDYTVYESEREYLILDLDYTLQMTRKIVDNPEQVLNTLRINNILKGV